MKFLGIDVETNQQGIWNVGLAVFQGKQTVAGMNIFIEETFTENPDLGFGTKYFKKRETLNKKRFPVWVRTVNEADELARIWATSFGFSRSFGYNSEHFDLSKMEGTMPRIHRLLNEKPHLDLMPLVIEHLVSREGYQNFWRRHVQLGNTHLGHPDYVKYSAELVLNYLGNLRCVDWKWRKEEHIGVEDLVGFEYPILHYFMRILKKGLKAEPNPGFLKWEDVR